MIEKELQQLWQNGNSAFIEYLEKSANERTEKFIKDYYSQDFIVKGTGWTYNSKPGINCLEYALLFWKEHPDYRIYYNSSHCINAYEAITGSGYLPAESFGYEYFKNSFKDLLSDYSKQLLELYFNIK